MGKVKNQHYVPRVYLRLFCLKYNNRENITVLKKESNQVLRNQSIENFCCEKYFYDTDCCGNEKMLSLAASFFDDEYYKVLKSRSQLLEGILSNLESNMTLFKTINDNPLLLANNDIQEQVLIMMYTLFFRTKQIRQIVGSSAIQGMLLLDPLGIAEFVKRYLDNYDMHFELNNTKISFITSDNPAYFLNETLDRIVFPISTKTAIVLIRKNKKMDRLLNESIVQEQNMNQYKHSNSFIFGDEKEIELLQQKIEHLLNV